MHHDQGNRRARPFVALLTATAVLSACTSTPAASPTPSSSEEPSERARPTLPPEAVAEPVIHVDPASSAANDDNDGSAAAPLVTIQAALDRAAIRSDDGESSEVVVAPGTYREELVLGPPQDGEVTDTGPIVVRGTDVVVTGADPVEAVAEPDGLLAIAWTKDWGLGALPELWGESYAGEHLRAQPLIRRRELVIADGVRLSPRGSRDEVLATAGTFVVLDDEQRILVHPSDGATSALFEVAVRDSLLLVEGRKDVTVRGLTFQYAASTIEHKAVTIYRSQDITLEDLVVVDNSWFGLGLTEVQGATIRRLEGDRNGSGGLTAFKSDDLLVEDSSTSQNGWRTSIGAPGPRGRVALDLSLVDFASGQKFFRLRRATFRRHVALDNLASGMWFDFDNVDVVVEDSTFRGNLTQGIFIEANQGPFRLADSVLCDNEVGLLIANSEDVTVVDSVIGDNVLAQLFGSGEDIRGINTRDGEDLDVSTRRLALSGTTVVAMEGQRGVATHLDDAAWNGVLDSLQADGNRYLSPDGEPMLEVDSENPVDLAAWQARTGQDATSTSGPATRGCPAA